MLTRPHAATARQTTAGRLRKRVTAFVFFLSLVTPLAARAEPVATPALLVDAPLARTDSGAVDVASRSRTRPPSRRVVADPRSRAARGNPLGAGLAAAGGAAAGTVTGAAVAGAGAVFALGILAGPQPDGVVLAASVVAIAMAVATPFLTALGAGAALLIADPRTTPDEWGGLLQCAALGYCAGISIVASSVLGMSIPCMAPNLGMPGPNRPAEWTAGASIAGLVGGIAVGALLGYAVAGNPADAAVPLIAGAAIGGTVGASVAAGVAGGIATALRQ